jgi:hypothetical protein
VFVQLLQCGAAGDDLVGARQRVAGEDRRGGLPDGVFDEDRCFLPVEEGLGRAYPRRGRDIRVVVQLCQGQLRDVLVAGVEEVGPVPAVQ